MNDNFKNISSKQLLEMYTNIKNFIDFLDKDYKNTEKMRDEQ